MRSVYFGLTIQEIFTVVPIARVSQGNLQVFEVLSLRSYIGWSTLFEGPEYSEG